MSIEGQGHFFTIYFPGFVCFVLYLAKISGERLQDHWSSGLTKSQQFLEFVNLLNTDISDIMGHFNTNSFMKSSIMINYSALNGRLKLSDLEMCEVAFRGILCLSSSSNLCTKHTATILPGLCEQIKRLL